MTEAHELYLLARKVLLDALDALGSHREAVVLVGAQAIYLRVGDADLAVTPFTTDGDLVIDPALLAEIPPLEQALAAAQFGRDPADPIGSWFITQATGSGEVVVPVDLMVPESVKPGAGRRAARLPGHAPSAARIVRGLDGALVDADIMRVGALAPSDTRTVACRVAGPAALLVAKVHKIAERENTDRQSDKDALDVMRLLRGTSTNDLATRYGRMLSDPRSANVAAVGRQLLETQFGDSRGVGIEMAIRSAGVLADPAEIAGSCEALASDLLTALRG